MRNIKSKIWILTFWPLVALLMLVVLLTVYRDSSRGPTQCARNRTGGSAFLSLRSLDGNANQLKASLFVPQVSPTEDSVTFNVVNGRATGSDYDAVLVVPPSPTTPEGGRNQARFESKRWDVNMPYGSASFFYPFESYVVNIQVDFKRSARDLPLNLSVSNHIDQTVVEKCTPAYSFNEATTDSNSFTLVLRRHRFIQIATVALYFIAFTFLFYIAIQPNAKRVLTNSLGYLAALWGIRGIIVGTTNLFPTMIDVVTLCLYLIVGSIVIYKLLDSRLASSTST